MSTRVSMLAMLVASANAHITMNPNYGAASGGYFMSAMKVPHGEHGMHTSRMVVHIPVGVMSVRPEVPAGWNVTVTEYQLAPEDRYTSHGTQVTTGPSTVIFQAETPESALYTDHLMMVNLQMKMGCSFRDQVQADYSGSASTWQGQHTLWFKVDQHSSVTGTLEISATSRWAGALMDTVVGNVSTSPGWNPPSSTGLKACPYIFIYAGTRCSLDHSGDAVVGGMSWMGAYLPPVANQAAVRSEEHVISLATEAALSAQEGLDALYADHATILTMENTISALTTRVGTLEADKNTLLLLAVVALAVGMCVAGSFLGLCCFRLLSKEAFARNVSGVPLMSEHKGGVTMTTANGV